MYFFARGSSGNSNGKRLLGAILLGTRYPTWRSHAPGWLRICWRLFSHVFQWNPKRQICSKSGIYWFGANSYWWVSVHIAHVQHKTGKMDFLSQLRSNWVNLGYTDCLLFRKHGVSDKSIRQQLEIYEYFWDMMKVQKTIIKKILHPLAVWISHMVIMFFTIPTL